jgi:hypothetical protein
MTRPAVKEREPRVLALAESGNECMEIGMLPMFGVKGACRRSLNDMARWASTQTNPHLVSSQIVTARICRLHTTCSARMAVLQHHLNPSDVHPTRSFISKKVRPFSWNWTEITANRSIVQRRKRIGPSLVFCGVNYSETLFPKRTSHWARQTH